MLPAMAKKRATNKKIATTPPAKDPELFEVFPSYIEPKQRDQLLTVIQQTDTDSPTPALSVMETIASGRSGGIWGVVCWRFAAGTGLNGAALLRAVAANPQNDLFMCHPSPELEGAYPNLWQQGNTVHPRLIEAADAFFKANGWSTDAFKVLEPSRVCSGSQYLIGNSAFWSIYLPFAREALSKARRKIPKRTQAWMSEPVIDPRDQKHPVTYWPLILERLMPQFLKTEGSKLRVARIASPLGERRMDVNLKRLREMKDVAHQSKSAWLASCWTQYRNTYFRNVVDRSWCEKHLAALTIEPIAFY
jgi:hypothetical protein